MSAVQRYRKILSVLLPAGALGMSILLGSTGTSAARDYPAGADPSVAPRAPVGERLAAIRDAVSDVTDPRLQPGGPPAGSERLAWHNWANFNPGWNDWRNKWKNWKNNWNNGWNNWNNGWNNWGNGWNNWSNY